MIQRPPRSTRTDTLFPYTTLFRSHPRELEMLVEGRDVGLIARYPVERFGENDIELPHPCISEQPLDAGAQDHARSRDGGIFIDAFDLPAFARRALAAEAKLIGDRRGILPIGRASCRDRVCPYV